LVLLLAAGSAVVGVTCLVNGGRMVRPAGAATTDQAADSALPHPPPATVPANPKILTILTANIRLPSPEDDLDAWSKRRELLVRTLLAQDADILGLQEASPAQTAYLLPNLKGYELANRQETPDRPGTPGLAGTLTDMVGTLNQVYYRTGRLKLVAAHGGPLRPEAPQDPVTENTFYTLAVLQDRQGVFPDTIVVDTHLRHGEKNAVVCAQKIHAIIAAEMDRRPGAAVVVMGDMNHDRTSPIYPALLAAKSTTELHDAFDYTVRPRGERWGTYQAFEGKPAGEWPVDLILASPNLAAAPARIVRDKDAVTGRYPSDHFFVRTTVQMTLPTTAPGTRP
jgi:endonuclease/exonuclease/phosphatase family metal-dependent hydrolase